MLPVGQMGYQTLCCLVYYLSHRCKKLSYFRNESLIRMKTYIAAFIGFAIFAITGCKKNGISFVLSNQTNFRVESTSPVSLPFEIATPDVTTNSSQEFQNNHTANNLIKEVTLQSLNLTITNPSTKTFSFLKSIHIYISTDGSDETELAALENISTTSQTISLNPVQANLLKYVKSDHYKLRTQVITKETLTQAIDISVNLKFKIKASLL